MSRSAVETEPGSGQPPGGDQAFSGRRRGLPTLSGPEVRAGFSFLGVRAILVRCLSDPVSHGGVRITAGTATPVSATYGTLVHPVSLAGGRPTGRDGGFSAATIGTAFGLIPYMAGRRRPAGRGHAADSARVPGASRRAVRRIAPRPPTAAVRAVLLAAGRLTARFGAKGAIAVAAGPAVPALAPWLRRTTHPVH
ncbi:hypothetical protein [Streptomyces albiflavescens]|uniref:hypothetical protein n=1 Tax=Streptomyces albiflavescens TaxID=1623582 RepID=UPI00166B15E8|nr:hypothetical protein [Streptomyces albiflavescens]